MLAGAICAALLAAESFIAGKNRSGEAPNITGETKVGSTSGVRTSGRRKNARSVPRPRAVLARSLWELRRSQRHGPRPKRKEGLARLHQHCHKATRFDLKRRLSTSSSI